MREIQGLAESISYRYLRTRKLLVCSSTRVLTHHGAEQRAQDNLVCEQRMINLEWGVESRLKSLQSHPTRNHLPKASLVVASTVRKMEMLRNG